MNPRETALKALIACRREGAWVNSALKDGIAKDHLDSRDGALAARLCYGVVQNRLKLDFYLEQLLTGKVKNLHPALRDILHLGLYQLYEMDRIPESAAVNESVALAKKYCAAQRGAPGLVNAVLRRAAQSRDTIAQPRGWQEKYSHPQALIDLLKPYVGRSMEAMLAANNAAPQTTVQVNALKITADALARRLEAKGIGAKPHPWMPDCLTIAGAGALERMEEFQQGLFYVQDAAARLSVLCMGLPETGDPQILDCCAAPGGKSFAAAIALGNRGNVISCDVHAHKIPLIESGAARLGLTNLHARQQDAREFVPQWEGRMDFVLADVPCSGFGVIRKKPDIRYKSLEQMEDLPALQGEILRNQARYVRPGGVLIYATCTLTYRENEGNVEAFLAENREFSLEALPLPPVFPANTAGTIALIPGQYDTDGFFIARMRRHPCT